MYYSAINIYTYADIIYTQICTHRGFRYGQKNLVMSYKRGVSNVRRFYTLETLWIRL